MTADRNARIEERAYHIWLEEGRPHGRHDEHWRRAERELIEEENRLREDPAKSQSADEVKVDQPAVRSRARSSRPTASGSGASGSVAGSGSRGSRRSAAAKPAG